MDLILPMSSANICLKRKPQHSLDMYEVATDCIQNMNSNPKRTFLMETWHTETPIGLCRSTAWLCGYEF